MTGVQTCALPISSTISLVTASSNASSFSGGGLTYNNLTIAGGGSGSSQFFGSNTFNIFTINAPKTVTFENGKTQTVSSFVATGDASNAITIRSDSAGNTATLSDSAGTNTVHYCTIQDLTATGGATWDATDNCTDNEIGRAHV